MIMAIPVLGSLLTGKHLHNSDADGFLHFLQSCVVRFVWCLVTAMEVAVLYSMSEDVAMSLVGDHSV